MIVLWLTGSFKLKKQNRKMIGLLNGHVYCTYDDPDKHLYYGQRTFIMSLRENYSWCQWTNLMYISTDNYNVLP